MSKQIIVGRDGTVRMIYDDTLVNIMAEIGRATVKRASHVEPDDNGKWYADMAPVNGPILGPFNLRAEALKAEVEWLNSHGLPVPK